MDRGETSFNFVYLIKQGYCFEGGDGNETIKPYTLGGFN